MLVLPLVVPVFDWLASLFHDERSCLLLSSLADTYSWGGDLWWDQGGERSSENVGHSGCKCLSVGLAV